jgi:hypothetical protein
MAKKQKGVFDLSKISFENLTDDEIDELRKQAKKDLKKAGGPGTKLKDFDSDDRYGNLKSGRPRKEPEPMVLKSRETQHDRDMAKAKKAGDVKEQKRLMNVKKSKEANIKAKAKARVPWSSPTAGRNIRSKHFIGKKMNMGGVMRNRGGTFKGTF